MTIEEVKIKRDRLALDIHKLVSDFTRETGLPVELNLSKTSFRNDQKNVITHYDVSVEIRL